MKYLAILLAALSWLIPASSHAYEKEAGKLASERITADAGELLSPIPVLHGGRIMPLDSFAKVHLLSAYHKSTVKGEDKEKLGYNQWFAQLVLDRDAAYQIKFFRLRNPDLIDHLGLEERLDGLFSLDELREPIDSKSDEIQIIYEKDTDLRTLVEKQLLDLNNVVRTIFAVSRSLTALTPEVMVMDAKLAADMHFPAGKAISYYQLSEAMPKLEPILTGMQGKPSNEHTDYERAAYAVAEQMFRMQQYESSFQSIALIPPAEDPDSNPWLSPWEAIARDDLTETQSSQLAQLSEVILALSFKEDEKAKELIPSYIDSLDITPNIRLEIPETINAWKVPGFLAGIGFTLPFSKNATEMLYNHFDSFEYSLAFYVLGFIFLAISWLQANGKNLRWVSFSWVTLGFLLHTYGLLLRMLIRGRPPVTTIYESIIFVGFTCVLVGLIVEWKRRDGLGLIVAIVPGSILHFVGFKYAIEGDTLKPLVAVLDSNFWLATHVVTITIGYGTSAVAGLIATVYLYVRLFNQKNKALLQSIAKNFVGITLVSLLFAIVGTILGGIWGDQSWGRFWGWDPKENGALLICLWLLLIVHGKWGKQLDELGYATMLSLTSITVLVAWFGVNLLSVGLHSYGFTDGALFWLTLSCGAIAVITFVPAILIYLRDRANSTPPQN
ncbi:cytochrome c biogenesis protein CcsA [Persicirhabdus sediminis]|uniref:Cytochrome c biogenesis protein CcsA n=2 Tax=Persicirhabdus sediminis TaxID=454144 RepID=A0A8J7MEY0_9BACT|nr:cytochrome c biogenesis protein CcsA [Persicirhabdus sediminis]